jgi:hypothetical protein
LTAGDAIKSGQHNAIANAARSRFPPATGMNSFNDALKRLQKEFDAATAALSQPSLAPQARQNAFRINQLQLASFIVPFFLFVLMLS